MNRLVPVRQIKKAIEFLKNRHGSLATILVPSFWIFGSISIFFYAFVQRVPKEYRPFLDVEALSGLAILLLLLPPLAAFVSRAVFMFSTIVVRDLGWRARGLSKERAQKISRILLIFVRKFLHRYGHILQSFFFFLVFAKFFLDGMLIAAFLSTVLVVSLVVVSANYYYEFSRHALVTLFEAVEKPFFPKDVSYERKLLFLLRSVALMLPAISIVLGLFLGWDRLAREVCVETSSGKVPGAVYAKSADGVIIVKLDRGMESWIRTVPPRNARFLPFSSIEAVVEADRCKRNQRE